MKAMAMSATARSFLQSAIESVVARKPFNLEAKVTDPSMARAHLTPRQLDVLRLLCQGMTNKDIGRTLDIGNATVKIHVSSILRSLNVTSRLQAAIVARRLGLIEEQDGGEDASGKPERHPVVLRVVWDGASAQIIGIDKETVY
ncbi:MAG: DNA-binding response regulator [Betaproteobacteria bacterium]|nr:DNA-binding response regulator [Betaproteobacteria bacterium]